MTLEFCPGYAKAPWRKLVNEVPGDDVYPPADFRTEWGPMFHRGRLDGTARVLVIGQDPAAHEAVCRRILVGLAGQRLQGFLAKLGITSSYVLVNAFTFSVYGQQSAERHDGDAAIAAYRHRWLDAIAARSPLAAVVTLGHVARTAAETWQATTTGPGRTLPVVPILHPTFPDAASRSRARNRPTLAEAMAQLCTNWNAALTRLSSVVTPDEAVPLVPYGATITPAELAPIPAADLPAGMPAWMRSLEPWASHTGADAEAKRATITVTVPAGLRPWR